MASLAATLAPWCANGSRGWGVGKVKIAYYVVRKGRGFWLVTAAMRRLGFDNVRCGPDGPAAWAIAEVWNARWQAARRGVATTAPERRIYPRGSFGDAFARYRKTAAWAAKKPRTQEDWWRGWAHIEPIFADIGPAAIDYELIDEWYATLLTTTTVREAYGAMKTWRALWSVCSAMKLCVRDQDPSSLVRRRSPAKRGQVWREGEVVRLAKTAWRAGYHGLACIIAVLWDTSFAPVDARVLSRSHVAPIGGTWGFAVGRTKTGEAALGTLSARARRLIETYLRELPDLLPQAALFRNRSGAAYSKDTLGDDFRDVRALLFGDGEKRQLMDMRRSGAVEALAGDATAEVLAAKMGNSIDDNKDLQRTYLPVDPTVVGIADQARLRGRQRIRMNKPGSKS